MQPAPRLSVAIAICLLSGSAAAEVTFHRIAISGDPYPGRPGKTYSTFLANTFLGPRSIDSAGNVYFVAAYTNGGEDDMLVYRPATGAVEPFVQSGFTLRGLPTKVFWGVVGGPTPGVMSYVALAEDPVLGPRTAVIVSRADGSHEIMGMELDQPPGYDELAGWFDVGLSGGAALDVNMNRSGAVTFGGQYLDQQGAMHYGVYRTFPGGDPEVLMDTRMPVPGHGGAMWVPYDGWLSPFEPNGCGIDDAGNAYFRAKYQDIDGKRYRVFFERAADGSLVTIADAGSTDPIPDQPPDSRYGNFQAAMNNRVGDVALNAEISAANGQYLGLGVYLKKAGGELAKLVDFNDPVPGIPDAIGHGPYLVGMSDSGYIAVANNHGLEFDWGKGYGYSLTLYTPDGVELIMRFDQLPGLPGLRATILNAIEVSERGDVLFTAKLSTQDEQYATYAYLNDTNTLIPILRLGDTLDGMKVLSYDTAPGQLNPSGVTSVTGGPVSWSEDRTLSITALLDAGNGKQRVALYSVQVGGSACAPDLDGSGVLDLFDFLAFVDLFNAGDDRADFALDGTLDLFDFLAFVNAFNLAC